ncbi:MAG: 16S rRNA (guanine(966)-N(2))-methyltransferase RsmD [Kiritimatiellae bacterium]|nr:16S rRNA (guanine(966)-N(2))-methyltransferase RsmD [Kiritimatiellia bacterium]
MTWAWAVWCQAPENSRVRDFSGPDTGEFRKQEDRAGRERLSWGYRLDIIGGCGLLWFVMRITGGILRGRRIRVPGTGVRPTQEMVREALFSIIGARIEGCRFLDLFAGSGAVGLGAWSRGASFVQWVERDKRVFRLLEQNVSDCCDEGAKVRAGDVAGFLKQKRVSVPFDIVFADPPYADARVGDGKKCWLEMLLDILVSSGTVLPDGLFVMEQGADEALCDHNGWKLELDRKYGQSRLRIFRLL